MLKGALDNEHQNHNVPFSKDHHPRTMQKGVVCNTNEVDNVPLSMGAVLPCRWGRGRGVLVHPRPSGVHSARAPEERVPGSGRVSGYPTFQDPEFPSPIRINQGTIIPLVRV